MENSKEKVWDILTTKKVREWDAAKYLKTLHTRKLLDILKSCRIHGFWDVIDKNSGHVVTLEELKTELATREHVPNKQEAKALRKERIKKGI